MEAFKKCCISSVVDGTGDGNVRGEYGEDEGTGS